MMVISLHDRISGHACRVRALDRFLTYARGKPDVWFARKDEIARYALAQPCRNARHRSRLAAGNRLARSHRLKKAAGLGILSHE
jgi:hypothetical protein